MKRVVLFGAVLTATFALSGCPIYPQSSGCSVNADCGNGWSCDPSSGLCYESNGYGGSGGSSAYGCTKPSDCSANETCGSDGQCDPGDCTFNGCVSGYQCAVSQGAWACVLPDAGAPPDSGPDAPIGVDSGPDVVIAQDGGPDSSGSAGAGGAAGGSAGASAGGSAGASTGGSAGASAGGSAGASTGGSAGASTGGATDAGSDAAPADAGNG